MAGVKRVAAQTGVILLVSNRLVLVYQPGLRKELPEKTEP